MGAACLEIAGFRQRRRTIKDMTIRKFAVNSNMTAG
jgi:hypothetical protein